MAVDSHAPLQDLVQPIVKIATDAGRVTLAFYEKPSPVEYKSDDSPLTLADRRSHESIVHALGELTPGVPVLSEESPAEEVAARRSWRRFWLVDPLDGTKEFIKKSGQFTVNIALVEGTEPVLGVVHVPVTGVTYFACRGGGAFVSESPGRDTSIRVKKADPRRLVIVASKDHAGPRVEAFLARHPDAEVTSMGSSLKFCLVAAGRADFYPRLVPTMEWDTGAAQCIVEEAGGRVTDLAGKRLLYNKESLRNPSLLTFGDGALDWEGLLNA